MLFGGDDSLIYIYENERYKFTDNSANIAAAFNMDIKYMNTEKTVCFASRYIVEYRNKIYCIPDLMKQLFRQNRILKTKDHVIAELISMTVLNEVYIKEPGLIQLYVQCLIDRNEISQEDEMFYYLIFHYYIESIRTKSYLDLYYEWEKLPNADNNTMEQLMKRIERKHGDISYLSTDPGLTEHEKQFFVRMGKEIKVLVEYEGKILSVIKVNDNNIVNAVADNIVNLIMEQRKSLMDVLFQRKFLILHINIPINITIFDFKNIVKRILESERIKQNEVFSRIQLVLK